MVFHMVWKQYPDHLLDGNKIKGRTFSADSRQTNKKPGKPEKENNPENQEYNFNKEDCKGPSKSQMPVNELFVYELSWFL